jgi:hypothetical protein
VRPLVLRYPLAYEHVAELLAELGVEVDPSCIWRWVQAYAPELNKRTQSGSSFPCPPGRRHPAAVALLDVPALQRRELAPAQGTAEKHRKNRTVPFAFDGVDVGLSEQVARLFPG